MAAATKTSVRKWSDEEVEKLLINQLSELGLIQQILSLGGFINVFIDNMISNSCFLLHQYLSMLDFAFRSCGGRFFHLVSFSFVCNKCK